MAKAKKEIPEILEQHLAARNAEKAVRDEIKKKGSEIGLEMDELELSLRESARDTWIAGGGCVKCNGTGSVLSWSTLDGASWDEHEQCSDCHGICPNGMSPLVRGVTRSNGIHMLYRHELKETLYCQNKNWNELDNQLHQVQAEFNTSVKAIEKRDVVIVIKGRKAPIGTVGVVVGVAPSGRIGVLTPSNEVVWIPRGNIDLLHPSVLTEELRKDLMVMWIADREAFLRSRGFKIPSSEEYTKMCNL